MLLALAVLGACAGVLTTLAGQGGGLFLVLAMSALIGPHEALAITTPALLIGNLHRGWLFRKYVSWSVAGRMIAGAIPGAIVGGLLAGAMPAWALKFTLALLTLLALARAMKWLRFEVPFKSLAPAGFVVGTMTGTSGGAGILFAPILLSAGLRGVSYLGTISVVALATHAGRVLAYASTGVFTQALLVSTIVVAIAITTGNALGEQIRKRTPLRTVSLLEYGVLTVCVGISLFTTF